MSVKDNEELRSILEKMVSAHVAIPWMELTDENPIKKWARQYNYYHDEFDEAENWAEAVLTSLTHAKTLDDLGVFGKKKFIAADWYVCSILLKSGFTVRPELLGDLLEKILIELSEIKVNVSVLGIEKARKGRPSDNTARLQYLGWLMFEVRKLTIEEGMSANQAYEHIGKQKNKAADTIRRDHERHMKERDNRKKELAQKNQKMSSGTGKNKIIIPADRN